MIEPLITIDVDWSPNFLIDVNAGDCGRWLMIHARSANAAANPKDRNP